MYEHQPILKKFYLKHGLILQLTCGSCPEQYDISNNAGEQIAYIRVRHGEFRLDYKDETIYEAFPDGDGNFEDDERFKYMTLALHKILERAKL